MLSPQEISDRLEIQDLLARYCEMVDRRDWSRMEEIFTTDAFVDYTAMGGSSGDLEATRRFLEESMPIFASTQHMVGLPVIDLEGDSATARTPGHNPMIIRDGADPTMMMCGYWYDDELVRTPRGWRISKRVERRAYLKNFQSRKDA